MDNKKNIRFITRTGILLALTVVFQFTGRMIPLGPNNNFIVGPLVNACLIISTAASGIYSGLIISVIAPYFAALTASNPFLLVFSPFIAAGNFALVLIIYLLRRKKFYIGLLVGSLIKFGILYGGVNFMFSIKDIPLKQQTALSFMFGWPQLVTALLGGILSVIVTKALLKSIKLEFEPKL